MYKWVAKIKTENRSKKSIFQAFLKQRFQFKIFCFYLEKKKYFKGKQETQG